MVYERLGRAFPATGEGTKGILQFAESVLNDSINTWSEGFMSHLYSSPNPVGVVSELLLAVLNTNVHVYETAPALSVVERKTTKALASLFGFDSPYAGGVSQQGGSASNLTALVTARNVHFPEIKIQGLSNSARTPVLFTSAAGHYSLEKAAQICGLGSAAVWSVPLDSNGRMDIQKLSELIREAREKTLQPFLVNATAGTTVFGSFDPLEDIGRVCKREQLWFHIDASWGGAVMFSSSQKHKMKGSELADSITFTPHKMLQVPLTCSFLLVSDLRRLWESSTLLAGYLFHEVDALANKNLASDAIHEYNGTWDIADMTLQCGRRGDSLKMAMSWIYYGAEEYATRIDHAFSIASQFADLVAATPSLELLSQRPPPCLSICFYYGNMDDDKESISRRTKSIARRLRSYNFAIEHVPGELGHFLRAVVNLETKQSSVNDLVECVLSVGKTVDQEM